MSTSEAAPGISVQALARSHSAESSAWLDVRRGQIQCPPSEPARFCDITVDNVSESTTSQANDPVLVRDRFVSDTLVYLAGRAVPAGLTIVSVPLFARALGVEAYGLFALASALALMAGNTAGGWFGQAVLRYASRLQHWSGGAFDRALDWALIVASIGAALLTAAGLAFLPEFPALGVSTVAVGASTAAYVLASARGQAALQPGRVSAADILRVGCTVGLSAAIVFLLSVREPSVLLLSAALGNVVGVAVLRRRLPSFRKLDWKSRVALERMGRFGAPLAGWMLISTLLILSDRYVIEIFLGTGAVGSYSAVYDLIFKGFVFLFTPMLMAAHPMIMDAWNRGEAAEANRVLRRTTVLAVLSGGLATVSVWLLAPLLLPAVLGSVATEGSLRAAGPVAAGAFLWQIAMLVHKPLEIRQRTSLMLVFAALALGVNVVVNVVYVPRFGVVVAGYSTMISAFVYLALVCASVWSMGASVPLLPSRDGSRVPV